MNEKKIGRLHVLTDFHFQQKFSHAGLALRAINGGADTIQFREKRVGVRHVLLQADEIANICRQRNTLFLVNDRIDVALAARADGVHVGQSDFPLHRARAVLPGQAVIGATATTVEQALAASDAGADYIGFGPVFETDSKANPATVKGIASLRTVCEHVDIPVIAIAGITVQRVRAALEAGAHGVAVMTAVTTAKNPEAATALLRAAIDDVLDA